MESGNTQNEPWGAPNLMPEGRIVRSVKSLIIVVLCLVSSGASGNAQEEERDWSQTDFSGGPLSVLFLPKVAQDLQALRDFIRSEEFGELRLVQGDLRSVDEIFSFALDASWGNRYEALLICLFATLDHARFGVS